MAAIARCDDAVTVHIKADYYESIACPEVIIPLYNNNMAVINIIFCLKNGIVESNIVESL